MKLLSFKHYQLVVKGRGNTAQGRAVRIEQRIRKIRCQGGTTWSQGIINRLFENVGAP